VKAEIPAGEPLFKRLLGLRFADLPRPVRLLHGGHGPTTARGACDVVRGSGRLSRIFAAILHLPGAGENLPFRFEFAPERGGERWVRWFGGARMTSHLEDGDGVLRERLGPARLEFRLVPSPGGIEWHLERITILGLPMPGTWCDGVSARASAEGDRYHFDVRAALPFIGLLVHYRGWLDVGA